MTPQVHIPSDQLLKVVRATMLINGDTLSSWAERNDCKRQNLTKALTGQWTGKRANALVERVLIDVGIAI